MTATAVPYTAPEFLRDGFNCPFCHAFAGQSWSNKLIAHNSFNAQWPMNEYAASQCSRCLRTALWLDESLIFPNAITAPTAVEGMPDDVCRDFEEARTIASASPRGAAALLRLSIQKLCVALGHPGRDLNKDIAAMVADGLPPRIQKALDIVRVIGNESVHPGTMDLRDDPSTTIALFKVVNLITEELIVRPAEVDDLFESLPEGKLKGIEERDRPKGQS